MPRTSIEAEIRNGLKKLQDLHQQRAKIDEAITQLESIFGKAVISDIKVKAGGNVPKSRKARKQGEGKPLGDYVREVLAAAEKGLRLKQIEERVLAAGYPTKAKSIYKQTMAVLSKGYKRVEKGVYALETAGKKAVEATMAGKPAAKIGRRRKRGTFAETAEQFILRLLNGTSPMTTAEINAAWKKAGRAGTADATLGKLVKAKKIKRTPVKGGRGSEYSLA